MTFERGSATPQGPRIVHIVGRVTDEVYSFLGPTCRTLALSGYSQSIIMINAERYRHLIARLDPFCEVLSVPRLRNFIRQWHLIFRASQKAIACPPPQAVHLHGFLACIVGAWAIRRSNVDVPIFYSPHASLTVGRFLKLGGVLFYFLRPLLRLPLAAAIINVPQEADAFERWESVELVESPIADVFFETKRSEAPSPVLITGGRASGDQSAEVLAQLAVLLSGDELKLTFNWIGTVDPASRTRLAAAGVNVFDVTTDLEFAQRLAAGWIYFAPGCGRGFPVFLVEAMAVGVPCVAMACAQYHEVIRHNETGFLCNSEAEMIDSIAKLIDSDVLRKRIGEAARIDVSMRFGEGKFVRKLLSAYSRAAVKPKSFPKPQDARRSA